MRILSHKPSTIQVVLIPLAMPPFKDLVECLTLGHQDLLLSKIRLKMTTETKMEIKFGDSEYKFQMWSLGVIVKDFTR